MTSLAFNSLSRWSGTFLSLRPLINALVIAVLGTFIITDLTGQKSINIQAIYSGIFDFIAIFTGFLSTFYVFVATRINKFLRKIDHTKTFSAMVALLKFTILWSFFMICYSYVMMVFSFTYVQNFSVEQIIIFVWVFNVALIAANFARCVRQFMIITDIDANRSDKAD